MSYTSPMQFNTYNSAFLTFMLYYKWLLIVTLNWFALQIVTARKLALVLKSSWTLVAISGNIILDITVVMRTRNTKTLKHFKKVHIALKLDIYLENKVTSWLPYLVMSSARGWAVLLVLEVSSWTFPTCTLSKSVWDGVPVPLSPSPAKDNKHKIFDI